MLLPLRLYLKIFRPSKQYVRLHPGLVLKEVSIQRRKTSQATGEQGTEQQVSSAETGGFWEDLEIGQNPHTTLQSRFCPASGSVISCSFSEFLEILPSFLCVVGVLFLFESKSSHPWVGVQVLLWSFGLELSLPEV